MTREEAIQWLTNEKWKNANNKYKKEWNEAFDLAIEALSLAELKPKFESAIPNCQKCAIKELWKETEKEDLVAVVHCKNCRFWKNEHLCLVMSRYGSIDTKAEHYCSWGERREP